MDIQFTKDYIYIHKDSSNELRINKKDCSTKYLSNVEKDKPKVEKTYQNCIVLGAIELLSGYYLIFSHQDSSKKSGSLSTPYLTSKKAEFFSINGIEVIPFNNDQVNKNLSKSNEKKDEKTYLDLIKTEFNLKPSTFYYTNNKKYDISRTLQQNFNDFEERRKNKEDKEGEEEEEEDKKQNIDEEINIWNNGDETFIWNYEIVKTIFEDVKKNSDILEIFFTPMIRGFIKTNEISHNKNDFNFTLISRLNWKRVGTRYNRRGVDEEGNASNFVETEQIFQCGEKFYSYVEIRGSIPLIWKQRVNLKYKPKIEIDSKNSTQGFQKITNYLIKKYKSVIFINLIDLKGFELILAQEFEKQNKLFNDTRSRYVAFDFHKETKGMKYENISKLIDQIKDDLVRFGYFSSSISKNNPTKITINNNQKGVARVNCLDSLDRTNCVENVIAKLFLIKQLKDLKILKDNEKDLSSIPKLEQEFKYTWADNGDYMAFIYTGTPALKRDFTRTGKRTIIGTLNDGYSSVIRYYNNNFSDGYRQDGMSLILKKYKVEKKKESPFQESKIDSYLGYLFMSAFAGSFGLLGYHLYGLYQGGRFIHKSIFMILTILFIYSLFKLMILFGRKLTNNPKIKLSSSQIFKKNEIDDEEEKKTK